MAPGRTTNQIDHLFRQSYGHIVSTLVGQFGIHQLDVIENATMEGFYKALKLWPINGMPENPRGWLYTVSRRKLIDALRKRQKENALERPMGPTDQKYHVFEGDEIRDPELRLLFVICHPEMKRADQLAFMLKLISGFGIREIANALLISEDAVKKRIIRARQFIRNKKLQFTWPSASEMAERRQMVHMVLYLLFNEGYYSSHPNQWIIKEFCLEAMRLCKYLSDHPLADGDTQALMSLMCFHTSRFASRTDATDNLVLLKDQDRSQWDRQLIGLGQQFLETSTLLQSQKTAFQIEAAISAQHCLAPSFDETDWNLLNVLYTALHQIRQNDLVLLNLIIVKTQCGYLKEAKGMFELFEVDKIKSYRTQYFLVGAELYKHLSDDYAAKMWVTKAIEHSKNQKEARFLKTHFLEPD